MDILWQLEIQITLMLQNLGDWLVSAMTFFSFLGTEDFYLLVLPMIYWSVDSAIGARVGVMLLLSQWTNGVIKMMLHTPRPYWIDQRVVAHSAEISFGMPSGHSMSASSLWGLMANQFKKRWFTIAAVIIIFLIGLSRIYLGVHFTSDVLVGWTLGGLLLFAYLKLEKPIVNWVKHKGLEQQLSIILVTSLVFLLLAILILYFARNWPIPELWLQNSAMKTPEKPIDPYNMEGYITLAGLWLGLLGGLAWFYRRYGMFNAGGIGWKRVVRYFLGTAGILVIWYGLGEIFPRDENLLSYSLRYIRYTLVGAWVTALAPWLFIRLRLASKYEK